MMGQCPDCDQQTLLSSMRADFCTNCGYEQRYEDAYADVDPGGDFENAEEFKP